MKIDRQIYFWAHMLDECFHKERFLTEGKHWPEDYIKTAYNSIKNSPLGQQSWYADNYIKQDIQTFVDEFAPLSHKNSNLGFFASIIRWFVEYAGSSKERYQEFIERKLDSIISGLLKIRADKEYDARFEEIKKMSFDQFMELVDEVKAKTSNVDFGINQSGAEYEVVPIYSYEELHEKYGGDKTGWHGQSEWCHTNGKSTYESWTDNWKHMFFVIQRKDWKSVIAPEQKPDDCYDEYGMSLIAILADVETGNLLNSTSRWNHIVLPSSGAADTMFESWQQLNKAVGIDVESICKKKSSAVFNKMQDEVADADQKVANILLTTSNIYNNTIPAMLKPHVNEVNIPDTVVEIKSGAFCGCSSLKSITIGNSVVSIGNAAFDSCTNLESVIVPDSVKTIAAGAFFDCWSLTSIVIPAVTKLGSSMFFNCKGLKSAKIGLGLKSLTNSMFEKCIRLESVELPETVNMIENRVFAGCTSLTSIVIPENVAIIGESAFSDCRSLKSIELPDSIDRIGSFAFHNCDHLESIVVGSYAAYIGLNVFAGCSRLNSIIFKNKTFSQLESMNLFPWGIEDTSIIKCEP